MTSLNTASLSFWMEGLGLSLELKRQFQFCACALGGKGDWGVDQRGFVRGLGARWEDRAHSSRETLPRRSDTSSLPFSLIPRSQLDHNLSRSGIEGVELSFALTIVAKGVYV